MRVVRAGGGGGGAAQRGVVDEHQRRAARQAHATRAAARTAVSLAGPAPHNI